MRFPRFGVLVFAASLPVAANSIVVSYESSVLLRPGDALAFGFSPWSYYAHTGSAPERMAFQLASLALAPGTSFRATLESPDGALAVEIQDVRIAPGYFQGTLYRGPVSTVSGSLEIPAAFSGVFSGPAAVLVLRNAGAAVTLGLPPYGIAQGLAIGLSGGGVSVGGVVVSAELRIFETPFSYAEGGAFDPLSDGGPAAVPEPSTALFLIWGGIILLLVARALRRTPRSRIQ